MGGLDKGMTRNRSITYNITPGIKGHFGTADRWDYELSFNHAEYASTVQFPEVIIDKSNALFLGAPVDDPNNDTGYPALRRRSGPLVHAAHSRGVCVDHRAFDLPPEVVGQ